MRINFQRAMVPLVMILVCVACSKKRDFPNPKNGDEQPTDRPPAGVAQQPTIAAGTSGASGTSTGESEWGGVGDGGGSWGAGPLGGLPLAGEWETPCIVADDFYGPYKVNLKFSSDGTVMYTINYYSDPGGSNGSGGCLDKIDGGTQKYTVSISENALPQFGGGHAFDLTDATGTDYNVVYYTESASGESFQLGNEYKSVDYSGMDANHRPKTPYTPETFARVAGSTPAVDTGGSW